MFGIGKRSAVALGAAGLLLAGAGTALAAAQAGPPTAAPRLGLQQMRGGGGGYGVMAGGVVMDAAADYLGMSETALAAERHAGKSLAQIAVAHGKTSAGLQKALVAAVKSHVDAAVGAGTLTQAQATRMLADFQARVQTLVTRTAVGPAAGHRTGAGTGLGLGFGRHGRR